MGILRFFTIFKKSRLFQRIIVAKFFTDESQGLVGGLSGDAVGIGAHVGDKTDGFTRPQFDTFIKLLSDQHGLFGRKSQLANGILLKFTGRKGRQRVFAYRFFSNFFNNEFLALKFR